MALEANYLAFSADAVATHGFGTACFLTDFVPPTPPALETLSFLAGMRSCTFSNHQIGKIDVTHLLSPKKYKESQPGFADGGQLAMVFLYSGSIFKKLTDSIPQLLNAGGTAINTGYLAPRYGRVKLILEDPWGNTLGCRGFLQPPTIETPEDGPMMSNCTFEITGPPIYTKITGSP